MEIVPILSTIILVGTVATFILAVAAYILYKMREGGVQETELELEREPHHVVMAVNQSEMAYGGDSGPAEASMYAPTETAPPGDRFVERNNSYSLYSQQSNGNQGFQPLSDDQFHGQPLNSFFWEYSDDGFVPVNVNGDRKESGPHLSAVDPEAGGE